MTLLRTWLLFAATLLPSVLAADKPIPTSASSDFPQCGIDCSVLNSAQDSCTAGAESSWTSCFCQSSLLTSLKTSGSLCSNCDSSDQTTLSDWYNSYCKSGGKSSSSNSNSNKNSNKDSTNTATTTSATSTATGASNASSKNATTEENKSWWSTHYQWVIMLIVLVIGFTILAILGVWLKRRYEAKRPNLYAGPGAASSSGALGKPAPGGVMTPPPQVWAQPPVSQAPSSDRLGVVPGASDSVASSSRTEVAPKDLRVNTSRLQKGSRSPAADVEIRQLER